MKEMTNKDESSLLILELKIKIVIFYEINNKVCITDFYCIRVFKETGTLCVTFWLKFSILFLFLVLARAFHLNFLQFQTTCLWLCPWKSCSLLLGLVGWGCRYNDQIPRKTSGISAQSSRLQWMQNCHTC